ncbi:DNA phosphorothioation-associated putative methyltransferase [Kribbella swartbergensis]
MSRTAMSRPMVTVLSDRLLDQSMTVFDYGCGRGGDVRSLRDLGYDATGWDPAHYPDAARRSADVVNLGYVINVIENPLERATTLRSAWALARRLLVVSARLVWESRDLVGYPLSDGVVTRTGTFQRFYQQSELADWIRETVNAEPVAAAPGIYYVFRNPSDEQQFLAQRVYTYRPRMTVDPHEIFEKHTEELAPLTAFLSAHGRPPKPGELLLDQESRIAEALGSLTRATQLIRQVTDAEYWEQVRRQRRGELLIYVALSRFGRRPRFSQLGTTLAQDIRTHFTSYREACLQADRLLHAAGDQTTIYLSARSSSVGKQTPTSLYVHRSALAQLPPLLQVYEGCARVLCGTIDEANVIKLSVTDPQVSYLVYPRFDRDAHPTLATAITVNLRKLSVDWRDYSKSDNPPLLHRKEEFIGPENPRRQLYERLTRSEVRAGLYETPSSIGTLQGWHKTLTAARVRIKGHRLFRD